MTDPMTPAQWHDDARNRDNGHDEMQLGVWNWLEANGPKECRVQRPYTKEEVIFRREWVGVEVSFEGSGRIVTFADICIRFVYQDPSSRYPGTPDSAYHIYEIKPKIWSCGAVIRQCAVQKKKVETAATYDHKKPFVRVFPVVSKDDPKLDMLDKMSAEAVAVWDGSCLRWYAA